MNRSTIRVAVLAAALVVTAGSASAQFDPTMYNVGTDPSAWSGASLIASLDAQVAGFNFNPTSGFVAEAAGFVFDRTDVRTDVYALSQSTVITQGSSSITLNAGDLVFAYRVRLVGDFPGLVVNTMNEAQVVGAPDFGFGQNIMALSLLNGQGFVSTSHGNNPATGNADGDDEFGSSVDWEWPDLDTSHLDNNDFITMLLFTDPASVGQGVLNMSAPPGQAGGLTGFVQGEEAPPVLIPIVPTPGAVLLGTIGLGFAVANRRRVA